MRDETQSTRHVGLKRSKRGPTTCDWGQAEGMLRHARHKTQQNMQRTVAMSPTAPAIVGAN